MTVGQTERERQRGVQDRTNEGEWEEIEQGNEGALCLRPGKRNSSLWVVIQQRVDLCFHTLATLIVVRAV